MLGKTSGAVVIVGWLWECAVCIHGLLCIMCCFFFFNDTATTEIYTLSLHDALPIFPIYKWVVSIVFCLGTEGSKGSLFRNGGFCCFSVKELKVPKVPYLEMEG